MTNTFPNLRLLVQNELSGMTTSGVAIVVSPCEDQCRVDVYHGGGTAMSFLDPDTTRDLLWVMARRDSKTGFWKRMVIDDQELIDALTQELIEEEQQNGK